MTGNWEDVPRYYDSIVPPDNNDKELTEEEVIQNIRDKIAKAGE